MNVKEIGDGNVGVFGRNKEEGVLQLHYNLKNNQLKIECICVITLKFVNWINDIGFPSVCCEYHW